MIPNDGTMVTQIMRVKGFNMAQILLIALWITVLIYFISTLMTSFLDGPFTLMTSFADAMLVLICLPVSIMIHRADKDPGFKKITFGLAAFMAIIVLSGFLMFVMPSTFNLTWLAPAGQLLWLGAYGFIILPLNSSLKTQRKILDNKISALLSAICVIAAVLISYSIIVQFSKLDLNGFNIILFAAFVICDIAVLSILSKLMLVNMPTMYRYFFAILFIFFFIDFLADTINFYTFLSLDHVEDIAYNSPASLTFYSVAEVILTSALVLYSSRNINPVTVEEVRETLQDTQCLMNDLITQSPDAICMFDANGYAIVMNDTFARIFSISRSGALGKFNVFNGTMEMGLLGYDLNKIKSGETIIVPVIKCPANGRFLSAKIYPTYTSNGMISGYVVVAEDITERTVADQLIKDSLEEKKVLLKEIHHRVKNNLQIVSSLLNVQATYITDKKALECFTESQNRVKSMALIHEKLYQSEDLSRVDFAEYIGNLSKSLFNSYNVNIGNIGLDIAVDNLRLDIDKAIPCGLIINELVSNSLKHAFPDNRKGEVSIKMCIAENRYILIISDNGVGFPAGIDYRNTTSLGLQLINMIVSQLDGTIDLDSSTGTKFTITFHV